MKKRAIILLLLMLALLSGLRAGEKKFNVIEKGGIYVRIYKGEENNIRKSMKGVLFDSSGRKVGNFSVIFVNDFNSIAKVNLDLEKKIEDIDHASIKSIGLNKINLDIENSDSYFFIDRGKKDNIKVGQKGKLYTEDTIGGIFKVVAVYKDKSLINVTQVAPNVNFSEINKGVFQNYFDRVIDSTGIANLSYKNVIMMIIGLFFIYLGIAKHYEPLLLIPIGFGIIVGNIPLPLQVFNSISLYMIDPVTHQYTFNTTGNSVLGILYFGVKSGLLPPLIFLGLGAMTDFTALLSRPRNVLLGAAAQTGIFATFLGALFLGFSPGSAASIGIIGGADGPTSIFISSKLAPTLIGPIAIAAYSYMAMVPIIQPPIMKLLTSKKERRIRMKAGRKVKRKEKIIFPIIALIITTILAPGAIPLLGMLFFGNLLKESGVTSRLAKTASNALIDIATIILGFSVGASTTAQVFLNEKSIMIFVLGVISFGIATFSGLVFAKIMNLFFKEKINPLIGAAGVSAVPDSARVVQMVGREEDPDNHLLMHAMGPNVSGVIGSAIAAGVFLGIF